LISGTSRGLGPRRGRLPPQRTLRCHRSPNRTRRDRDTQRNDARTAAWCADRAPLAILSL